MRIKLGSKFRFAVFALHLVVAALFIWDNFYLGTITWGVMSFYWLLTGLSERKLELRDPKCEQ